MNRTLAPDVTDERISVAHQMLGCLTGLCSPPAGWGKNAIFGSIGLV